MTNDEFYQECARLLNTEALGRKFPYRKRTRWNQRVPGQGRFAGRGLIRCFGDKVHVALNNPVFIKVFDGKADGLQYLENM